MDNRTFKDLKELEVDRDRWRDLAKSFLEVNPTTLDKIEELEIRLKKWQDVAGRAINRLEHHWDSIQENGPACCWSHDIDGKIIMAYNELAIPPVTKQ